ncbi:CPBP family intramembrane glutamic endopeptidase [Janthinobacterium rivuli]|uniref:CPBP family intramembrane glutamic endopeptidase n=1 Tax=Janthinobacterium rivuli TaxID=2751478 RepID=UPI00383AD100
MLNILLTLYLLFVFPALNVWRSLRPKSNKLRPLLLRYWSMSWHILVLLSIFGIGSWQAGYTLREIGFDLPLSSAGTWGLAFAVMLLCSISLAGRIIERRKAPLARAENERKLLDSSFPWPRTGAETLAFAASMSLTSAGWEILYRGFVLLVLTPSTGLPIAIAASALAYGIGHGYKNPKQLIASIVSAFVFTIAYALTHSLWWLIVIHVGLPLISVPAVLRARQRRETEIAHAV